MLRQSSQISGQSFPRDLGVTFMFTVFMLVAIRSVSTAAEKEEAAYEPPAKIIIDAPQPDRLARGVVIIRYRTENLQIVPVFGPAALAVSPRIGHLHVTLDDTPWGWAHTSGEPLIISGLTPGPHKILIDAANANHAVLARSVVEFEVPQLHSAPKSPREDSTAHVKQGSAAVAPAAEQPPVKIIVDRPQPGPLSRGVVFIKYRPENLQIAPVFGPAALAISPPVGHLHVTVDDVPWHWADASGGPVIVSGLSPGPHKIAIELADANHQSLAQEVVKFEVPPR